MKEGLGTMKNHSANAYTKPALLGEADALRFVSAPRATRVFARMLMGGALLIALALMVVPWQQNSPGKGRVSAYTPVERQQNIEAPIEGRLAKWYVQEGTQVREGDAIADIVDNDPEIMQRLEREKEALEERIMAAKNRFSAVDERILSLRLSQTAAVAAADARVRMARDRVRSAEQGLEAAEAAKKAAELNFERQEGLFEKGLSSKRTFELSELEKARTQVEVERARASLSAAKSEVAAMQSDLSRAQNDTSAGINDATASRASAQSEIASAKVELARIEVRLARQSTQAIKAPRNGTILRVQARQGTEMVKAGDVLAILVPDTQERAVEMWIDGNDINLVRPGRKVRLQFEGWPAIQASGWPTLAVGTFGGRVAFVDASDDGKGKFRVMVVPSGEEAWPQASMLRQGTRANGWILLDRVSLAYELWRQLNGFPPEWSEGGEKDEKSEKDSKKGG